MNTTNSYLDFHVHTNLSDGKYSPEEVVTLALSHDISIMAITDHNRILSAEKLKELMQFVDYKIHILKGSEVSCRFDLPDRSIELHIIALFPDMHADTGIFEELLIRNTSYDRRNYIGKILDKLRTVGVDIGTYDDLVRDYPNATLGRPQVTDKIVRYGYAKSVDEAMDLYIGNFGERRAYVENPQKKLMPTLAEVIHAIHACKGMAILAHLIYYKLTEEEEHILLKAYSKLTGLSGGMETNYRRYSIEQRKRLAALASLYRLFQSNASDYHGVFESDGLDNAFSTDVYDGMMERWMAYYKV